MENWRFGIVSDCYGGKVSIDKSILCIKVFIGHFVDSMWRIVSFAMARKRGACMRLLLVSFSCSLCHAEELPTAIAEWKLNEGEGSIVKDSAGNACDGQIVGAKWVKDDSLGNALFFDGKGSHVVVKDTKVLDKITDQLTIEATVKPISKVNGFIISKEDAWGISMKSYGGWVKFVDAKCWEGITNIDVKPEPGRIYHIVGVWSSKDSAWSIYIDGCGTTPSFGNRHVDKINKSKFPVYIGTWKWEKGTKDDYNFEGIIANVKIYNTAFNRDQVATSFSRAKASIENKRYLVFRSPSFNNRVGAVSPKISVERKTPEGFVDTSCNGKTLLSSSNPSGEFAGNATPWTTETTVNMKNGVAEFYYKDIKAGDVDISVSMEDEAGVVGAKQAYTISSRLGYLRHFVDGDTFEIEANTQGGLENTSVSVKFFDTERKVRLHGMLTMSSNRLDISMLPPGDYTVSIEVFEDGNIIENRDFRISKITPTEKPVKLLRIEGGICKYDSKPYLPIVLTMWTAWDFPETVGEGDIQDIASKGFDTITVGWEFLKDELAYEGTPWFKIRPVAREIVKSTKLTMGDVLDVSHRNNLKVIFRLQNVWASPCLKDEQLMAGASIIRKYITHPAVLCWQSYDETDGWIQSNLEAYRLYKEIDVVARRPVYLNLAYSANAKDNVAATDIISCDPYPIGQRAEPVDISIISKSLEEMKIAVGGNPTKAIWHTIQLFGSPGEAWERCPTPSEVRCMVFLALNHGAKGLVFFNYYPKARRETYSGRGNNEELWSYMKNLNGQIKDMSMPYLTGQRIDALVSDQPEIDIFGCRYDGKTYLVAVNKENKTVRANMSCPGMPDGIFEVKYESRHLKMDKQKMNDVFSGYEVHIYENNGR